MRISDWSSDVCSSDLRTGPYAPSGIPVADGFSDYVNLINERDGGLNGVKLRVEECETQYNTERGVECYERLKAQGGTIFSPYSTGITYALIEQIGSASSRGRVCQDV